MATLNNIKNQLIGTSNTIIINKWVAVTYKG